MGKLVELPDELYAVNQVRLPPNGDKVHYYVSTLVPESLNHIMRVQVLYGKLYFSKEEAQVVCDLKNGMT